MRLDLTPDQEFLRETTAKFLDNEAPLRRQRDSRHDPAGFGRDYWHRGADLGWTSFLVSEANGGGSIDESGLVDLTLIAHEFGRAAAPGPLLAANLAASALNADTQGDRGSILEGILAGTAIATYCLEEAPGAPVLQPALHIQGDGREVVVNGTKRAVEAAAQSDHLVVAGAGDVGLTHVLVPRDAPGLTVRRMETVDLTRRFGLVEFDEVRLPNRFVLGVVGQARPEVERIHRIALVVLSAEMVGAMERAFEMTLEWAFARYSFGRPLASYQELKHRFADMKCWLEASHAIADAAAAVVEDPAGAAELASAAKAYTGHYGGELMQDCVQIHGGIGLTFDHDLHILLRRLTVDRMLYGDPAQHRQLLATFAEGAV